VSATETPPAPQAVERRCPRCEAHLSAEQEWCLSCGAAVGTVVAGPRGWKVPLAVVGGLLALALIALVLALVELSSPAEKVQEVQATPTPAPAAATPSPVPTNQPGEGEAGATPTTTPEGDSTPSPTTTPEGGSTPALVEWPAGKTAWTIVVNSSGTKADAERLAGEVASKGVPGVGVLDSNDFESLGPDSFVVFAGQYPSKQTAEAILQQVKDRAGGGSVRRIVPR
jgi:septal ring-binding cell division protein DamX